MQVVWIHLVTTVGVKKSGKGRHSQLPFINKVGSAHPEDATASADRRESRGLFSLWTKHRSQVDLTCLCYRLTSVKEGAGW